MPAYRALVPLRQVSRRGERRRAPGDGGFSLVETLVGLAVISIVMAGTAPFLAQSVSVVGQQRTEQGGIAVANDALDRVHALAPTSLLAGRGLGAVLAQRAAAPTAAQSAFADTEPAGDPMLTGSPGAGADAPLPTQAVIVTIGGAEYAQNWYVGECWQPKAKPRLTTATVGDCIGTQPTGVGVVAVPYFQVVVAVTWQHYACDRPVAQPGHPADECVYVTSTLVSTSSDPVFDLKRPPPTVGQPDNQVDYVGDPVTVELSATGGNLPLTWSQTGLPNGLFLSPTTGIITGRPTTAGTSTVIVTVVDRDGIPDSTRPFTWLVNALPVLVKPPTQTSRTGTFATLNVTVTGGVRPMTFTITGLPVGLTYDPSTGVISGTPTQVETRVVTMTAVDAGLKKTPPVSFSWRVLAPVTLAGLGSFDVTTGDVVNFDVAAAAGGGLAPYTWKATGLPTGLTMAARTGVISGKVNNGTRYLVTVEVTDSAAGTATAILLLNVAYRPTDLRVTAPDPADPDQNTQLGTPVALTTAAAGTSGYKWTVAGLPPGLTFTSAGVVGGSPSTAGSYIVTFAVTDTAKNVAKLMFVWTVTP